MKNEDLVDRLGREIDRIDNVVAAFVRFLTAMLKARKDRSRSVECSGPAPKRGQRRWLSASRGGPRNVFIVVGVEES